MEYDYEMKDFQKWFTEICFTVVQSHPVSSKLQKKLLEDVIKFLSLGNAKTRFETFYLMNSKSGLA